MYKLDLLERSPVESTDRLHRYLQYQRVISGEALSAARNDYRDVARDRLIADSMPKAWHHLLSGPDGKLAELLADKVEDICGYKPDPDACSQFIQTKGDPQSASNSEIFSAPKKTYDREQRTAPSSPQQPTKRGFSFRGKFHSAKSAREVIQKVLITFSEDDPEFLERFAARSGTRKRNFIAKSQSQLYLGRPDLASFSVELVKGWWMGTNYGKSAFTRKARLACEVANVEIGKDLVVSL